MQLNSFFDEILYNSRIKFKEYLNILFIFDKQSILFSKYSGFTSNQILKECFSALIIHFLID